jgi:hypothetical protein
LKSEKELNAKKEISGMIFEFYVSGKIENKE